MNTNENTNTDGHRLSNALMSGAARFYEQFPEVDGIQLDTVRHFAQERFLKAATPEIINDLRFETEAPVYYYTLLVKESLKLAQALKAEAKP